MSEFLKSPPLLAAVFAAHCSTVLAMDWEKPCSGKVVFNDVEESLNDGDIKFKPLQERVFQMDCKRWGVTIAGDIQGSESEDPVRREDAYLSYSTENWRADIGYLGEERFLRGLFSAPGKRPSLFADQSLISVHLDNPDARGVKISGGFGDGLHTELAVMSTPDPNQDPAGFSSDRANSSKPSFTALLSRTNGDFTFGFEGGRIENGVLGDAPERYSAIFAHTVEHVSHDLTWRTAGEVYHADNAGNQEGVQNTISVLYTNLEHQFSPSVSTWVQVGTEQVTQNDYSADHVEVGARYDHLSSKTLRASVFGAAGARRTEDQDHAAQTREGWQAGLQMTYNF
jgi:hypothetical protein